MLNINYTFPTAYENSPKSTESTSSPTTPTRECTFELPEYYSNTNYTTTSTPRQSISTTNSLNNRTYSISKTRRHSHRRSDAIAIELDNTFGSISTNYTESSSCFSSIKRLSNSSVASSIESPILGGVDPIIDLDVVNRQLTPSSTSSISGLALTTRKNEAAAAAAAAADVNYNAKFSKFLSISEVKEEDEEEDSVLKKANEDVIISLIDFLNESFDNGTL